MEITNIKFRNFRSYGNQWTEFSFPKDGGELISIYGESGAGKSSISDILDWTFYKKVRGKKRLWATLSSLYNRFNGATESDITFNVDNIEYNLKRSTSDISITSDSKTPIQGGKNSHENFLSSLLELDIDTFKNFVSVDISDFRSFSSMKTEAKRDLMDRLFSLSMLTNIGDIASQIALKNNQKSNESLKTSDVLLQNSIKQKENSVQKEEELKNKLREEQKEIKKEGKKFVDEKSILEKEKFELSDNIKILEKDIYEYSDKISQLKYSINNAKDIIVNINNPTCPFCLSEIDDNHRDHIKEIQKKKGKSLLSESSVLEEELNNQKDKKNELSNRLNKINTEIQNLSFQIQKSMSRYSDIQKDLESDIITESYWEDLEKQSLELKEKSIYFQEESKQWTILKSIFSENGIKKDIMENICNPINEKMSIYALRLNFPYEIKMDSTFDLHFFEGGLEIDVDTLSKGEESRANMALLLSWLSIIHSRVKVNLLFLDEIFKPLDPNTTDLCIKFIKDWAIENKVNVITTHHSELPTAYFDKVYHVTKNIFSDVKRIK